MMTQDEQKRDHLKIRLRCRNGAVRFHFCELHPRLKGKFTPKTELTHDLEQTFLMETNRRARALLSSQNVPFLILPL